jgi:hypothetical protein
MDDSAAFSRGAVSRGKISSERSLEKTQPNIDLWNL